MKKLAPALLSLLPAAAISQILLMSSAGSAQAELVTRLSVSACKHLADARYRDDLLLQRDDSALEKFERQKCRMKLSRGEVVKMMSIEDLNPRLPKMIYVCVRPTGRPDCGWVNFVYVETK